jgi:hypothetical protein
MVPLYKISTAARINTMIFSIASDIIKHMAKTILLHEVLGITARVTAVAFLVISLLIPLHAIAATPYYNCGSYGGDNYNSNCPSTGSSSGSSNSGGGSSPSSTTTTPSDQSTPATTSPAAPSSGSTNNSDSTSTTNAQDKQTSKRSIFLRWGKWPLIGFSILLIILAIIIVILLIVR